MVGCSQVIVILDFLFLIVVGIGDLSSVRNAISCDPITR